MSNLVLLVLHTSSKQTWSIIIALNWSTTSPKNFKKILEQRLSNKSLFKSVYNVVTVCRMVARRPATPPWLRPLGRWNPSAGSRCGPGGPSGAISPKFTPCTGAQSRGTNRLIQTVLICSFFFVFLLCSVPLFRQSLVQSSDDCVARHSTFWFKHPCMTQSNPNGR